MLFAPDTSEEVYQPYLDAEAELHPQLDTFQFTDSNRWGSTHTSGGGLAQGQSTTILWSIVPDGTSIAAYSGVPSEVTADSDLFSWLGGIYGSNGASTNAADQPWFYLFEEMFDRWGELTGLNYQYVNEQTISDWTGTPNNPNIAGGQAGVRGDVRIAAHFIDGPSNILAYNYFPNVGDMVLDSGDTFFNNLSNDSRGMRNVLAHEHGHGIGLNHVDPVNQTKLMEPFVSLAYDGPQFDDILAANRGYGDNLEEGSGNDSYTNATALSDISNSSVTRGNLLDGSNNLILSGEALSIDDNSDTDFFSFAVTANQDVTITLSPEGYTYLSGPQNGTTSNFNAAAQSNLTLTLFDTDGTSTLVTANANGAGGTEIINYSFSTGGTYFVRITGDANAAQMYQLDMTSAASVPTFITGTVFDDTDGDGTQDGGEVGLTGWTVFIDENDNGVLDTQSVNVFNSTDVPVNISASGSSTVTSDLTVSGIVDTIADVNVTLDISHTYDSDLDVFLISPTGTRVELFSGVGGSANNFTSTTLDDEASTPIESGSAPFSGSYIPEQLLSTLDGEAANGTWTLEITDNFNLDGGSLNSWSIQITSGINEVSTTTDGGGDYSFSIGQPGTYTIDQVLMAGFTQTAPVGGDHTVVVTLGNTYANRDFGNRIPTSNEDPDAVDDPGYSTDEDTVLNVGAPGVLGNDSDPDTDPITVTAFDATSTQGASVTVNANGSFTYDPTGSATLQALNDTESLNDTFTYTISDGNGGSDTATVTVNVTGADEPPPPSNAIDFNNYTVSPYGIYQGVGNPGVIGDGGASLTLNGNTWQSIDFAYNVTASTVLEFDFASTLEGEIHGIGFEDDNSAGTNPEHLFQLYGTQTFGTQNFNTYNNGDGTVHYVINVGTFYTGAMDRLVFAMDDDNNDAGISVFSNVEVYEPAGGNTAPDAVDDPGYTTDEDTVLNVSAPGVLGNDSDPDTDPITVSAFDSTSTLGASVSVNADGSFSYDPTGSATLGALDSGASLNDTFTYTISDGNGGFDTATVTVNVDGVDDAPPPSNVINFNDYTVSPYGIYQGVGNPGVIGGGGASLTLNGNTWQSIDFAYNVTTSTVLEFDFASTLEGEIHGIGFDNDNAAGTGANQLFQLFGTQSFGSQNFNSYNNGDGTIHYVINVGTVYTGAMDRLVFAMDDDNNDAGNSVFSNVEVYEAAPPSGPLDFNNYTVSPYGIYQGVGNPGVIGGGGSSLTLTGNTWQSIDFVYNVTANTVLEFDFASTLEGEIHGIGFEDDNSAGTNPEHLFQLYGTQTFGTQNFNTYNNGDGTVHYVINVGTFYTGAMDRLVFAMDDDNNDAGIGVFSNVEVYEGPSSIQAVNEDASLRDSGNASLAAARGFFLDQFSDRDDTSRTIYRQAWSDVQSILDRLASDRSDVTSRLQRILSIL